MQDQHTLIKGYRDLSAQEIALINDIKAYAGAGEALLTRVKEHLAAQFAATQPQEGETPAFAALRQADAARIVAAEPGRWLAMARTDMQTGNMALTRAVAQPTTF